MDDQAKKVSKTIRLYMGLSAGAGLIPIPLADLAAITALQMKMLFDIAKIYEVPFRAARTRAVVSGLIGGALPMILTEGSAGYIGSLGKSVPIIGPLFSLAIMPGFAAASTYAVGQVFARHFESGGTFETIDPDKAKADIAKEYHERKTGEATA
jgi:uncharacterized protein (DUF697 family)